MTQSRMLDKQKENSQNIRRKSDDELDVKIPVLSAKGAEYSDIV